MENIIEYCTLTITLYFYCKLDAVAIEEICVFCQQNLAEKAKTNHQCFVAQCSRWRS